jgi:hypothetical protein
MMKNKKIDFKECPFCGSLKIQAIKGHPDYDHVGDQYHEPMDCGDCGEDWVTIYSPSRNQSDALTALEMLNSKCKMK